MPILVSRCCCLLLLLPLLLLLQTTVGALGTCNRDREVLLEYEHAGALGWQSAESGAEWERVGVQCDDSGFVTEIGLPARRLLPGTLPLSWSKLSRLGAFSAASNGITGSLPPQWSVLGRMWYLSCVDQELTGTLPPEYSRWNRMTEVVLYDNQLSGTLPKGYSEWRSMWSIDLHANQLTGMIPENYSFLRGLTLLHLSGNQMTGTIPISLTAMFGLEELTLSDNLFGGQVPVQFSALKGLNKLELGGNRFTGALRPEFSTLTNLERLGIEGNALVGTLPLEWSQLRKVLSFRVNSNALQGSLPRHYSTWRSIEEFSALASGLSGELPLEFSEWTSAKTLQLGINALYGTVPHQYSTMVKLEELAIQENSLSGQLPAQFSVLSELKRLDASDNSFSGTLPHQWSRLSSLEVCVLEDNELSGVLPVEWSTLARLASFTASENSLSGELHWQWALLHSLQELVLHGNSFNGSIPTVWGNSFPSLAILSVDQELTSPCVPGALLDALDAGTAGRLNFTTVACRNELADEAPHGGGSVPDLPALTAPFVSEVRLRIDAHLVALNAGSGRTTVGQKLPQLKGTKWEGLAARTQQAIMLFRADVAELTGQVEQYVEVRNVTELGSGLVAIGTSGQDDSSGTDGAVVIEVLVHFPANTAPQALGASLEGAYFPRLGDSGVLVSDVATAVEMGSDGVLQDNLGDGRGGIVDAVPAAPNGSTVRIVASIIGAAVASVVAVVAIAVGFAIKRRRTSIGFFQGWEGGTAFFALPEEDLHIESFSTEASKTHDRSGPVDPAGLRSLATLLANSYFVHSYSLPRTAGTYSASAPFGVFAACVIAAHLQLARRWLLVLVSCMEDQKLAASGAAPPDLSLVPKRSPHRELLIPTDERQNAAMRASRVAKPMTAVSHNCDFNVDWYTELRGKLGIKLGSGAFGQVYKAKWRGLDVAVKLFSRSDVDSRAQIVSFKAEIKVMARLAKGCDRIVRMYGACLTPPHVCILYEYVSGGSLHDLIYDQRKSLSYSNVLRIGRDVCQGLAFMHPTVVHRDLKPQNILLDGDGRAKICDFGLGRTKDPLKSHLTTVVGGTPNYMAPEVFTHSKFHSKADVYAIGVIMYEMMARKPPWNYDNPFQVIYAVSVQRQRPEIPETCNTKLARLIQRCWHQDVQERPSAVEVLEELDGLIEADNKSAVPSE